MISISIRGYAQHLVPGQPALQSAIKSFCKGQSSHKSVNLSFIITNMKDQSTDLCGDWLLQNAFINTLREINKQHLVPGQRALQSGLTSARESNRGEYSCWILGRSIYSTRYCFTRTNTIQVCVKLPRRWTARPPERSCDIAPQPDSFLGAQRIPNEDVLFYQRSSSVSHSRFFYPSSGRSSQLRTTTETCSGFEAGSCLRLIDFVDNSTLGLRVMKKKVVCSTSSLATPPFRAVLSISAPSPPPPRASDPARSHAYSRSSRVIACSFEGVHGTVDFCHWNLGR